MIRIGKIAAAHGLQGAVILTHIADRSDWLKKDDVLFLELQKGSYIPFFVTHARAAGDGEYIVQLDETGTAEAAKKLIGKQVYVREDVLSKQASDSPLLWIGFNVVDKHKGGLGILDDVMQTGTQWLGKIIYEGKEVLIPLVRQTIVEVNIRNRFLRVDLPEGLLEVYLNE